MTDIPDPVPVAEPIARRRRGTAVLQPEWRKDTEEGREARRQWHEQQRRETVWVQWIQSAVVLGLLLCVGVVWFLVARAS